VPIVVGLPEPTVSMWRALLDAGVYANIVLPPACRAEACVLRTSYSAAHTAEQIDRAIATFEQTGHALGILHAAA
jgi:8-amino-7-oxononanoate synthase